MGVVSSLERWYEANRRVFSRVHDVSGTVAGIGFVLLVPFAAAWAFLPDPAPWVAYGAIAAGALFALAVLVQTAAGLWWLGSWFGSKFFGSFD